MHSKTGSMKTAGEMPPSVHEVVLVECPDEVFIEQVSEKQEDVIKISCKKDEIRKVIGKNGKTINSIRSLVRGAAKRLNKNISVVIVE